MKKIIVTLNVLFAMIANGSLGIYPDIGFIKSVDFEQNSVIIETFNGNCYTHKGVEDWLENDYCALIMYDNGTKTTKDDNVICAKYTRVY